MGHLKTVIILAGGCVLFGEAMPPKKLAGVVLGMSGILWCASNPARALTGWRGRLTRGHLIPGTKCRVPCPEKPDVPVLA